MIKINVWNTKESKFVERLFPVPSLLTVSDESFRRYVQMLALEAEGDYICSRLDSAKNRLNSMCKEGSKSTEEEIEEQKKTISDLKNELYAFGAQENLIPQEEPEEIVDRWFTMTYIYVMKVARVRLSASENSFNQVMNILNRYYTEYTGKPMDDNRKAAIKHCRKNLADYLNTMTTGEGIKKININASVFETICSKCAPYFDTVNTDKNEVFTTRKKVNVLTGFRFFWLAVLHFEGTALVVEKKDRGYVL